MKTFLKALSGSFFCLLLVCDVYSPVSGENIKRDNYASIDIPVAEFGFRGIGEDGKGTLYVSSLLKNGVFLLPNGCRTQDCSSFIELSPPLSAPGRVITLPYGGAFVLQRFGDRIVFVPKNCMESSCTKTILLPNRPSYPSGGEFDPSNGSIWVSDELSNQIGILPEHCYDAGCMSFIGFPSKDSHPSGIANDPDTGFWVTERAGDRIAFIPRLCRTTSCVKEYPIPSRSGKLRPFSPVSLGKDRIAFLVRKGNAVVIGDIRSGTLAFHFIPIEEKLGKATRILGGDNDSVVIATKGELLHVGRLTLTKSCLASPEGMTPDCLDFKSIPIPRGEPFGLSRGAHGFIWITLRNRDEILRVRLEGPCLSSGRSLPPSCFTALSFSRSETLYHRKYHQEVSQ
jgi:hypothetical protein